ncbi:MAG: AAA family ATPase [Candidatus Hodarchaeales archaeon]
MKEQLRKLGDYDLKVEVSDNRNGKYTFEFLLDSPLHNYKDLSSGEKELINFIMAVYTFDLRNATIIIDEPELHLHTQWQKKLLSLYDELITERNLQIICTTHSSLFIAPSTMKASN